ncbi:MAG: permease-like cell division protein FtsX [Tractidigestivibacter sp.]|jgi:cell division transport system permease protein|uniref:permease-like cell division protein FtsX n=1 Tax=Tractidigestivibacter sp. TaxID=2847320 RepID=UPI003D8C10FC
MVPSNFTYSLRECGHHFKRNWSTVLGAVVTIFLSLFIIGVFAIASEVVNNMVGTVEDKVTIQAFLSDDADQATVEALEEEIKSWDNVQSVEYRSKDENLEQYRSSMSQRNAEDAVVALDGENPIPASIVIKLYDSSQVESTAQRLIEDETFQSVCDTPDDPSSDVQYGRDTVEKLFSVTNIIRIVAIVLVVLLTFVAFVFINNTIRLAISARRREIAIMRLVGASNSFIRGPFMMEGTLEALIGAILAVIALAAGMSYVLPRLSNSLQFLTFYVAPTFEYALFGFLILLGIVIGMLSSAIAMRRYLKV